MNAETRIPVDTNSQPSLELDLVDWQQLELLAKISPAERLDLMMAASDFSLSGLRGAFKRRFPDDSPSQLNLRVLAYVTPIRGVSIE